MSAPAGWTATAPEDTPARKTGLGWWARRILTADDTGIGIDLARLLAAAADTGTGADSARLPPIPLTGLDTGIGADNAHAWPNILAADTGTGTDTTRLRAILAVSDTGVGVDTAAARAAVTATDTGHGTDLAELARLAIPIADTGAGTDTAILSGLAIADTGIGADAMARIGATASIEAALGVDVAELSRVAQNAADTGAGADTIAAPVTVHTTGLDSGAGSDSARVVLRTTGADTATGTDQANAAWPVFAPLTDIFTASGVYTIPWWADTVDRIALGGGKGGNKAPALGTGAGGNAGQFGSDTITRGISLPWGTTQLTVVVGNQVGGDANGVASSISGTGVATLTGAGGSGTQGGQNGQAAGSRVHNGVTYQGGAGGSGNGNGTAPGGGGGGGNWPAGGGGNGARGQDWFCARQNPYANAALPRFAGHGNSGPTYAGTTSTQLVIDWYDDVPPGATAVILDVIWYVDSYHGLPNPGFAASHGGQNLPYHVAHPFWQWGPDGEHGAQAWQLKAAMLNPQPGRQMVRFVSGYPTDEQMLAHAVTTYYRNVGSFGAAIAAAGASTTPSATWALGDQQVLQTAVVCWPQNVTISNYSQLKRAEITASPNWERFPILAGDAGPARTSVPFTAALSASTQWSISGIPLLA